MPAKLTAGTGVLFVLAVILGVQGLVSLGNFKGKFDEAANTYVRQVVLSDSVVNANSEMISAQRGIVLAALGKNSAELKGYKDTFQANVTSIKASAAEIRSLTNDPAASALLDELDAKLSAWLPHYGTLVQYAEAGNAEEANRIRKDETAPIYKRIDTVAREMTQQQTVALATEQKRIASQYNTLRWFALILMGLVVAAGGVVLAIVRGSALTLRSTVSALFHQSEQVEAAARQLSAASRELADGSSEQAAALEETSASTGEISTMARSNSSNSDGAALLVGASLQKFQGANESLAGLQQAMTEIEASSGKVSKIIQVIDGIAFQTNILALNAAVEAARAGEAGMGFAVVADEVRNLAHRSAEAARETASLIEESVSNSDKGKSRANQVVESIRLVAEESAKVKALVDKVKQGSQQQAQGLEQIGRAIVQMEQVTQRTAATAEESASASRELSSQSEALKEIVANLTAMVGRGKNS